jgi:hypothetical protein
VSDDSDAINDVSDILNGKAYKIIGGRGTSHCWVSAAECGKGYKFLEVLNNMSIKMF